MTDKDLLKLKSEIDQAKTKLSELKGKKQVLMESLKKDYDCSTVSQAAKKLIQLQENINDLTEQKEESIKELEDNYEF